MGSRSKFAYYAHLNEHEKAVYDAVLDALDSDLIDPEDIDPIVARAVAEWEEDRATDG